MELGSGGFFRNLCWRGDLFPSSADKTFLASEERLRFKAPDSGNIILGLFL